MSKYKNYNKDLGQKKIIDVESTPVQQDKVKPTLEKGNYLIEILENEQTIKKIAVANAEIKIIKLAEGGMAIDLK